MRMHLKSRLAASTLTLVLASSLGAPLIAQANTEAVVSSNYSNYSVEQIETLIVKLQKQLAEMKQATKCFVSDSTLSLGDGEPGDGLDGDIRRLQTFLKEKGYVTFAATGYFGKMTRASLMSFQKASGVSATGEFDGATREKAHALYCKKVLKLAAKPEIKKEEPKQNVTGVVRGISLSVSEGRAFWKVDGYSAQGYKVVWSKNSGPTYPTRDGDRYAYLSEPSASETKLEAFSGSGTYAVRVCEYLGGSCGKYSNEVQVQL